jgi:hypothetical protein
MSKDNDELDFLDSLESNPPANAKSPPNVGETHAPPTPAPAPLHKLLEFAGIALISAALTAGLVVWKLGPRDVGPPSGVDAVTLGRAFVPKLANALADGFDAGAAAIKSGKSLGEGDAIIKTTFHSSRAKAFEDHAGKAIHDLVPDGQEFTDGATRSAMVDLFEGFAKGLRGAK